MIHSSNNLFLVFLLSILLVACSEESTERVSRDTSLFSLKADNAFGLIDEDGEWVVNPRFDRIEPFKNGMAKVWKDGKYGWVNALGEVIAEPRFSRVTSSRKYLMELYLLEKIPVDLKDEDFSDGLAAVNLDGKHGFIDQRGDIVIPQIYDEVSVFVDGVAAVRIGDNWGFIDKSGAYIVNPMFEEVRPFSDGMAAVEQSSWGYIDKNGEIVINPMYDLAKPFQYGSALVGQGDLTFLIDQEGEILLTIPYPAEDETRRASKDLIVFASEERRGPESMGLMNLAGETIIGADQYRFISNPYEGMMLVYQEGSGRRGKFGFIDEKGEILIQPQFDQVQLGTSGDFLQMGKFTSFDEGALPVRLGDSWGAIDKTGKYVVAPQYEEMAPFKEGLAAVENQGKYGFIAPDGELVIPIQFDMVRNFKEGLAGVRVGRKWGFIDPSGTYVVSPQYDEIGDFQSGFAYVATSEPRLYGYIDQDGDLGERRFPRQAPEPPAPVSAEPAEQEPPVVAEAPQASAAPGLGQVVSLVSDLRVRQQPNPSAQTVEGLDEGESASLTGQKSNHTFTAELRGQKLMDYWYQVRTSEGSVGWVFGGAVRYQDGGKPFEESLPDAVINDADGYTNVRLGPGSSHEVIGQLRDGQVFKVHQQSGDWWMVRIPGASLGYMHRSRVQMR